MKNQSDWLNRADYTAEERRNICAQLLSEAQYWDVHQYLKMMHDSTKRPWVGLTDEEIEQGCKESWVTEQAWQSAVWWAEAKLKEKNT
tara:strand:- start:37 stop:300 length:264 start_codon:yes stop_codon:yes gene_type:complete